MPLIHEQLCVCGQKHAVWTRLSGVPVLVCRAAPAGPLNLFQDPANQTAFIFVTGDATKVVPGKAWFRPKEDEAAALRREYVALQERIAGGAVMVPLGLSVDQLREEIARSKDELDARERAKKAKEQEAA